MNSDRRPARPLALAPLASLLWLAPVAAGQDDRAIEADMRFARELAERFTYIDLAEEVIADLEARGLSGDHAEAIDLVKCDVYAAGAKSEPSAERRLELYDKAVEAYKSYLEENRFSDFLPEAQRNYVDLVNSYGRVLEIQLADQVGEEAEATREKIRTVLEGGLELTGDLIDALGGDVSQVQKLERWRLMLNRGQMLLTLANVSESGTFLYGRAESTLEELALEAGDTSAPGLNAFVLLAKVKRAQGLEEDAAAFVEFVVDLATPSTPEGRDERGWNDAEFEEKAQRWKLTELATKDLVEAYAAMGDVPSACKWALHYYNMRSSEGFDLSPLGHLSMLACATVLLDSGGYVGGSANQGTLRWFATEEEMTSAGFSGARNARSALELALQIAQSVKEENQGNTLEIYAQKVISDVVDRPGVVVSPDILYDAALGEYRSKEYQKALDAFRGMMRQLDGRDVATQQEYAAKVLYHVGGSLSKQDRHLESAMAYREAATTWAGDPDYHERVAGGFYSEMKTVKAAAPNDSVIHDLYLEAERIYASAATNKGAVQFRRAARAYDQKDYANARSLYLQVEPADDEYEKAIVKAAVSTYKLKDLDAAREELRKYLEEFVKDPNNAQTGVKRLAARSEAMAQATYYMGLIAYQKENWAEAVRWLGSYDKEFPDQDSYAPNALYMVVKSHLAQEETAEAKKVAARMQERFAEHARTGTAAASIYTALKAQKEKAEADGATDRVRALELEMAEAMHVSNELAKEPNFDNLRVESVLWVGLERWTEAEAVLRDLVSKFQDDPEREDDLQNFVLPDLGLALLEQKRVPEAFEVLDPLIPRGDDESKPSSKTVRRWCRAVTGWVEGDAQNVIEVPGQGGADNFQLATEYLLQLTASEKVNGAGDWTCPWFELKFDTCYAYAQWGQEDSTKTEVAVGVIRQLKDFLDQPNLDRIEEECGDDVLRKRFLWLWDKIQ